MLSRTPPLLRPRDGDALRAELRAVAGRANVPVLFGGEVSAGTLHLTEFFGTRTNGLKGLVIPPSSGLGGRVVLQRQPASVPDYGSAMSITHHYDRPVLGEGIRSVLAVPVLVDGASRAVLYAAVRESMPIGDRTAEILVQAGRRLGTEIAIRDEVDRRLQMLGVLDSNKGNASAAVAEGIRDAHAELRGLAQSVPDGPLRGRLRAVSEKLAALVNDEVEGGDTSVTLSPRELDVLAHIALGCTNNEVAHRLSLQPETVKSYLRAAMGKLDAHSRHEAVVAARRLGLLP
ncbi:helix-turn-helix transcriptional regulator [Rhodococcus sp. UNC363MFTsu5.1]|uniref:helix-turn-helix transcriptional regulator n=1 Tax=Rhodococcus sp. UNC363MFTsu5.1 TaxID=1449069 RepID=UPI000487F7B1|nr:LuxR C-terminal-related transcriptional regulator [Rhodococcus sp. UNC363MFTsu5.1]